MRKLEYKKNALLEQAVLEWTQPIYNQENLFFHLLLFWWDSKSKIVLLNNKLSKLLSFFWVIYSGDINTYNRLYVQYLTWIFIISIVLIHVYRRKFIFFWKSLFVQGFLSECKAKCLLKILRYVMTTFEVKQMNIKIVPKTKTCLKTKRTWNSKSWWN